MTLDPQIIPIDCEYVYPQVACAYLVIAGQGRDRSAAFVENNTSHAVPGLLQALEQNDLRPEQVRYAMITHVHLDHAGGTSALLQACPNAVCVAHPKAARHVINPERLIQSSRAVYGDEMFTKLYGRIDPVDESRVRVMQDNETLDMGPRKFHFFFTRGHADHHFCILEEQSEVIFTGDSFGIGYPRLQTGKRPFLFPSTTPTQFDADEARKSVHIIRNSGARVAGLTHFGPFFDMKVGAEQLLSGLDQMEELLERAVDSDLSGDALQSFCEDGVRDFFRAEMEDRGMSLTEDEWKLVEIDAGINAMGLAYAAERIRKKTGS